MRGAKFKRLTEGQGGVTESLNNYTLIITSQYAFLARVNTVS